jgi:hypothetical protein
VGLRKLLTRPPANDPLESLAELEEAGHHDPTRQFAQPACESAAAFPSLVAVEKKPESESRRARGRPNYIWLSGKNRRARTEWADQLFRPF